MKKQKRKLSATGKAAKRKRRQEFETIFVHGKMKRVRRPPMIEGLPVDEYISQNADPLWLHQNEMWEYMVNDETEDEFERIEVKRERE